MNLDSWDESTLKIVSIWIRVICFGLTIFLIGSRRRFEKLLYVHLRANLRERERVGERRWRVA